MTVIELIDELVGLPSNWEVKLATLGPEGREYYDIAAVERDYLSGNSGSLIILKS